MKQYFRLVLVAFLLAGSLTATARFNGNNREAPAFYAGLRAGVGASMYYNLDDPVGLGTPVGGLALGIKVASFPLYVETGAYYMDMGTRFKDRRWYYWDRESYYSGRYHDYDDHSHAYGRRYDEDRYKYKLRNQSVMVPLVATYHLYAGEKIVIQPFTGFYGSYGFDNEKMDFGLREGVGVTFGHFYVGLGMNIGLVEQKLETDEAIVRDGLHASAFLTLGINF